MTFWFLVVARLDHAGPWHPKESSSQSAVCPRCISHSPSWFLEYRSHPSWRLIPFAWSRGLFLIWISVMTYLKDIFWTVQCTSSDVQYYLWTWPSDCPWYYWLQYYNKSHIHYLHLLLLHHYYHRLSFWCSVISFLLFLRLEHSYDSVGHLLNLKAGLEKLHHLNPVLNLVAPDYLSHLPD